jgi:hypothetical protein
MSDQSRSKLGPLYIPAVAKEVDTLLTRPARSDRASDIWARSRQQVDQRQFLRALAKAMRGEDPYPSMPRPNRKHAGSGDVVLNSGTAVAPAKTGKKAETSDDDAPSLNAASIRHDKSARQQRRLDRRSSRHRIVPSHGGFQSPPIACGGNLGVTP